MGPACLCSTLPACLAARPMRCSHGDCALSCTSGGMAAGVYRSNPATFMGCEFATPYYCPGKQLMCVADRNACEAQTAEACKDNCERDAHAVDQVFFVQPHQDTTVELSFRNGAARARVTFYAGTFLEDGPIQKGPVALRVIPSGRVADAAFANSFLSTAFVIKAAVIWLFVFFVVCSSLFVCLFACALLVPCLCLALLVPTS